MRLTTLFQLAVCCLITALATVHASDFPSPPGVQTYTPAGARFEIIQSPLAARWTFRLDKYSGRVWQLARTNSNSNIWQEMMVFGISGKQASNKPRFQIFTSGLASRHTFLIDSESGNTWLLVSLKNKDKTGAETEISAWEKFDDETE